MTGQIGSILDVAIVLAALYIALSCVCSFVIEQIAALLSLRGQKLFLGVLNLVSGAVPLVRRSSPTRCSTRVERPGGNPPQKCAEPASYVDARNFSMAFWQSVLAGKALAPAAAAGATAAGASASPTAATAQVAAAATAIITEPKAFLDAVRRAHKRSPTMRCARASARCS